MLGFLLCLQSKRCHRGRTALGYESTAKTNSVRVCECVCTSAQVPSHTVCTSLISLGKCSLHRGRIFAGRCILPGGTTRMCVCGKGWGARRVGVDVGREGVGCNCSNCKQSLVLSSSVFPLFFLSFFFFAADFPRLFVGQGMCLLMSVTGRE